MKIRIIAASLLISGCANNASILNEAQRKMVDDDGIYIHEQLPNIYSIIGKENSLGALVVVPVSRTTAPQVTTGESPIAALHANPNFSAPRESICYFIYSRAIAAEPLRAPCGVYLSQAKQLNQFTAEVADQKKQIADMSAEMARLEKGQFALGSIFNPLLAASNLNTAQIELLQKQTDVISGGFDQSIVMQQKTNDTLQKTLLKLNENNDALNKKLDTLAASLSALK